MKKEYFYYVLVFTKEGPIYVTKNEPKTAYWNKEEKPKEFSKEEARDIVWGLTANMFLCVMVELPYILDNQPYAYKYGEFTWNWKKEKKEEE